MMYLHDVLERNAMLIDPERFRVGERGWRRAPLWAYTIEPLRLEEQVSLVVEVALKDFYFEVHGGVDVKYDKVHVPLLIQVKERARVHPFDAVQIRKVAT